MAGNGFGGGSGGGNGFGGGGGGGGSSTTAKTKGPPSLLGQTLNLLKSAPSGIYNTVKGVLTEPTPVDLWLDKKAQKKGESFTAYAKREAPTTTGLAQSYIDTGQDIIHPSRFGKASAEGNIVGKVVGDVANLLPLTGVAAKGFAGAAARATETATAAETAASAAESAAAVAAEEGLTSAGAKATEASRLRAIADDAGRVAGGAQKRAKLVALSETAANKVAGAPLRPYAEVAKLVGRGIKATDIGARASAALEGSALGKAATEHATRRAFVEDMSRVAEDEAAKRTHQIVKVSKSIEKIVPDKGDQAVVSLLVQGEAKALERIADLPPVDMAAALEATFRPDERVLVTPEVFDKAVAFERKQLEPAEMERLAAAVEEGKKLRDPREAESLAGVGMRYPLNPEQLGTAPLSGPVEAARRPVIGAIKGQEETRLKMREKAAKLGARAATAESRIGTREVRVGETPTNMVERAAVALRQATDRLRTARAAATTAEGEIAAKASKAAQSEAEANVAAQVKETRKRAAVAIKAQTDAELRNHMAKIEAEHEGQIRIPKKGDPNYGEWTAFKDEAGLGGRKGRFTNPIITKADGSTYRLFATETRAGTLGEGFSDMVGTGRLDVLARDLKYLAELRGQAKLGALTKGLTRVPDFLATDELTVMALHGTVDEAVAAIREHPEAAIDPAAAQAAGDEALSKSYEKVSDVLAQEATPTPMDPQALAELTPEERALRAEYHAGAAVEPAEARLGEAREATTAKLVGAGRRVGTVEGIVAGKAAGEARVAERIANLADRRLVTLQNKLDRVTSNAEQSLKAAPDRFRIALAKSRTAVVHLNERATALDEVTPGAGDGLRMVAKDIPVTLDALVRAGVDPEHLIGGSSARVDAQHVGSMSAMDRRLPRQRKLRAEKRATALASTRTVVGQAKLEAERGKQIVENVAARYVGDAYATTPRKLGLDPELRGVELQKTMFDHGFTAWEPKSYRDGPVVDQINHDTLFLPTNLFDSFRNYFEPATPGKIVRGITRADRAFKSGMLALSPRWHVGNVVGNLLMATIGGGLTPYELVHFGREAYRVMKNDTGEVPLRVHGKGMGAEELKYLQEKGGPRTAYGRLIERSYRLNGLVDDWNRSALYLAKRARGFSEEEALRGALKVAGDFQKLSPLERNVIRPVLPFYAWYKHITRLTLSMPFEHPLRTAWLLHLADLYGQDQENLPAFLQGAIALGGADRFLNLGNLFPFGDVGRSPLLSVDAAAQSVSPTLKLAAAAATGLNVPKLRQFQSPPGYQSLDDLGRPTISPLIRHPAELAYLVGQTLPQGRLAMGLAGKPILRYETGEPLYVKGKTVPTGRGRGDAVQRYLGIPSTEKVPAGLIQARANERRLQVQKARAKYEKQRKK